MRNIVALDGSQFALDAIQHIVNSSSSMHCSLATKDISTLLFAVKSNREVDVVFVHVIPKNFSVLRLIQALVAIRKPPRVIVMLEYAHVPTLKLILSLGVRFILLRRDSIGRITDVFQQLVPDFYISPELEMMMARIQKIPLWAKNWGIFNDIHSLTTAEACVLIDLLEGVPPWRVARRRFVSTKTISTQKLNAMKKLGEKNINVFFSSESRATHEHDSMRKRSLNAN